MHDDLIQLLALNDADDALDTAKARLSAAKSAVKKATQQRDAALTTRDEAQAELDAAKAEERALNRKVEQYEARRATATRALEMGAGDPDAAERQISQVSQILDDSETLILELMEKQEGLTEVRDAKQKELDAQESALKAAIEAAPAAIAETTAQEASASAERDHVRAQVRKDMVVHYERVRQRKRKPVVRLNGRTCPSCQLMIGAARVSELKRGVIDILVCPGCHRIVVLPD